MTKELSFSNGEFYVGLDHKGLVQTLSFPYIGSEIHSSNRQHKIGIWVDSQISWLDGSDWTHKTRMPYGALVANTILTNKTIGITIEFEDFVDTKKNVLVRNVHIINLREEQREVRLFMHQSFIIGNSLLKDTAQFLPIEDAILHYCGNRAFIAGGQTDIGKPADQHSIGLFGNGLEGTWRDSEDGELEGGDVQSGQVDSTLRFALILGGLSSRRVNYWLCVANSIPKVLLLHRNVKQTGVASMLETSTTHWRKWMSPSFKVAEQLREKYRQPYIESLISLKSHIDKRGAVVSKTTSNSEAYCKPREAAYAAWPLIRLGYRDEARNFFDFCQDNLTKSGYLMSRYRADGSIGSSNLPYSGDMSPIQSDQVASVIFVLTQFYSLNKRHDILNRYYSSLLKPMADFLCNHIDVSGLPKPSYDSGEKFLETGTYTTAITYASLSSAADLADKTKDESSSVKWRNAAETMFQAARSSLVTDEYLLKSSTTNSEVSIASFYGSFMYDLFDLESNVIASTAKKIEETLKLDSQLFGTSPGSTNIDYVGSIWMAQYYMEIGLIDEAHLMLEQISRDLTLGLVGSDSHIWACAEFINALLDTLAANK